MLPFLERVTRGETTNRAAADPDRVQQASGAMPALERSQLAGAALIVLPGPAFVVIPIGLAILSIEFAWARRWLKKVRETISENAAKLQARKAEARKDEAEE